MSNILVPKSQKVLKQIETKRLQMLYIVFFEVVIFLGQIAEYCQQHQFCQLEIKIEIAKCWIVWLFDFSYFNNTLKVILVWMNYSHNKSANVYKLEPHVLSDRETVFHPHCIMYEAYLFYLYSIVLLSWDWWQTIGLSYSLFNMIYQSICAIVISAWCVARRLLRNLWLAWLRSPLIQEEMGKHIPACLKKCLVMW